MESMSTRRAKALRFTRMRSTHYFCEGNSQMKYIRLHTKLIRLVRRKVTTLEKFHIFGTFTEDFKEEELELQQDAPPS